MRTWVCCVLLASGLDPATPWMCVGRAADSMGLAPTPPSDEALTKPGGSSAEFRIRIHSALLGERGDIARQLIRDLPVGSTVPQDVMVRMRILDATSGEPQTRELAKLYQNVTTVVERVALMRVLNQRGRGHWAFGSWADFLRSDPTSLPALYGALDVSSPSWSTANQYSSIALDLVESGEPLSRAILARMPSAARLAATDDAPAMASALLRSLRASISANSPAVQGFRVEDLIALQASLQFHSGPLNGDVSGYQGLVASKTHRPSVYYRLARWNECGKNPTGAMAIVDLGLQNCSSGEALLLGLSAELRAGCGDFDGAFSAARRCLEKAPANPMAQFALCEAHVSVGDRPAAMEACAQGLSSSYGWGQEVTRAGNRALAKLGLAPPIPVPEKK